MNVLTGRRVAVTIFAIAFVLTGGLFFVKDALAATGQMYLSPSTASVQNGNSVVVNVRINPGTATDTVTVTVGYDPSKLHYVSTDYSGSPYNTQVGASTTSNSISFSATELSGTAVSTDSQVAKLTFTAAAGSGSTSLTLTGNAAYAGASTSPATAGATITLTSPPATCPAGQTGTPPNCVTPPSGGSGSGSGSGSSGGSSGSSSGSGSGSSGSGSSGGSSNPSPSPSGSTATGTPVTVAGQQVQYTKAVLDFTSKTPTQVYIRFGLDGQLTTTTPVSDYATTHAITIDPSLLVPGQEYSYVAYSTNQQGATAQTVVQHFKTKGLKVVVGVFDANQKPIKGKTVTLHSTPQTVKTNDKGFATFDNVAPGTHNVVYTTGKKTYSKEVSVVNNVQTAADTQTATAQNFSVMYGFTQSDFHVPFLGWVGVVILMAAVVIVLARTGRLGFAVQLRKQAALASPTIAQSVVVGSMTGGTSGHEQRDGPDKQVVQERLNAIPDPTKPQPGSTVAPKADDASSASQPDDTEHHL